MRHPGITVVVFVIVSSLFTSIRADSPPRISGVKHGYKLVRAGATVKIPCPLEEPNNSDYYFDWKKGDEVINDHWLGFKINLKGVLRIETVTVEDAGIYECHATNGFGEDTKKITLAVVDDKADPKNLINNGGVGKKPKFDSSSIPRHVSKPAGATIRLKCKASGDPLPRITWLHGDEVMDEQHNTNKATYTLKLTNATPRDSGQYTCYVHNRIGSINRTFTVDIVDQLVTTAVIQPPHPTNITVAYGSTASFQCRVTSAVAPHMKWLKKIDPNVKPKPEHTIQIQNDHLKVLESGEVVSMGGNSYLSKLVLVRVTPKDSGMYICFCMGVNSDGPGLKHKGAFLTVLPKKPDAAVPNPTPSPATLDDSTSSSLILEIAIPTIALVVIISLLVYLYIHRGKRCGGSDTSKRQSSTSSSQQNIQRVPLPLPEKDYQGPHFYQAPREKFSTMVYSKPCNSTDIYSDISSVSQSRYSPHGHSNGSPMGFANNGTPIGHSMPLGHNGVPVHNGAVPVHNGAVLTHNGTPHNGHNGTPMHNGASHPQQHPQHHPNAFTHLMQPQNQLNHQQFQQQIHYNF